MALVSYDNSDSSEYEEEEKNTITQIKKEEKVSETEQLSQNIQSIFSLLPQPSNIKKDILEEDDDILHKKEHSSDLKPKSRITIPSLNDFKDVEHTVPSARSRLPNEKKSGLLSILPEPRNAIRSTTKSLIPNVVAQKPQTNTVKRKPLPLPAKATKSSLITDYSDESDNEDVQNDFFAFNKKEELPIAELPLQEGKESMDTLKKEKKEPRSIESYFKKEIDHKVSTEQNVHCSGNEDYYSLNVEQYADNAEAGNSNEVVLDDEAILKLCGTRAKRKREDIQIVDVNQQEVLGDAKEWLLKGLMDDTTKRQSASKKHGNEPTSQQRRKHQITYLAHQAKANEAELQNQWANNRMSKRKTQSKYGF